MSFDIQQLMQRHAGEELELHERHVNPQFAKVLRTIGFDRQYVRGEGPFLWDADGRRYLDFLSGYGVFNVGRNHPTILRAIGDYLTTQSASLVQMSAPLLSGLLAKELKERVAAPLERVYFTNSGAEGVETAIKFAQRATRRPRTLSCNNGYHGMTKGALSVTREPCFREGFDPLVPGCQAVDLEDLEALERELSAGDVACFIVEPIQGKGVFVASDEYLRGARALCKKHGTLLVFDEVQTGLGRTGTLFAHEPSGVEPDMLVISKALSGGFVPVGAVLTRKDIFRKVFRSMEECVVHSSTFGQGDLAMVVGLATLHVLDEEGIVDNARRMGHRLIEGLRDIERRYELVKEVRGRGLMVGIEFGRPKSLKLKLGWDLAHKVNSGLFGQAIVIPLLSDFGILTQVAGHNLDVIKLIPPLVIGEDEVREFLEAFERVVEKSHRFPGPIWEVTSRLAKHALRV